MSVYVDADEEKAKANVVLKGITKDTKLGLIDTDGKQHFTQPPAHFTEAALVKALEEQGIGRPSNTHLLLRLYLQDVML